MTLSFIDDLITPTDDVWSVSQLTNTAKRIVEGEFVPIWVRGEMVECKAWKSGHWYFKLRDARSQVSCCMFKREAARAGKPPVDGTEVFVLGRPGIYEAKGEFQLNVMKLIPTAAIGKAQQELERVKARLHQDGLFDPARKRPLPALAATLAVVTSTAGAALRDIINVARRRWPGARLLVIDARVQGGGAVEALVSALRLVNRLPDVDLCIVGRGGGGRDDLTAFNAEAVCRALAAVRVPTISAVGHETDISLTDLVADVRAPTPSAAAELALADQREVRRALDDVAARLAGGLAGRTRPTATCSSAGRSSTPARPLPCGWPTATSPPGWSPHDHHRRGPRPARGDRPPPRGRRCRAGRRARALRGGRRPPPGRSRAARRRRPQGPDRARRGGWRAAHAGSRCLSPGADHASRVILSGAKDRPGHASDAPASLAPPTRSFAPLRMTRERSG